MRDIFIENCVKNTYDSIFYYSFDRRVFHLSDGTKTIRILYANNGLWKARKTTNAKVYRRKNRFICKTINNPSHTINVIKKKQLKTVNSDLYCNP